MLGLVAVLACGCGRGDNARGDGRAAAWTLAFETYPKLPPPAPAPTSWFGEERVPALLDELPIVKRADQLIPASFLVQEVLGAGDTALVVASGIAADGPAVVVFDSSTGEVKWADSRYCNGPVVHVSASTVVCAGGRGAAGLATDGGEPKWTLPYPLRGANDGIALMLESATGRRARLIDLESGASLETLAFDAKLAPTDIKVVCRRADGFDFFGWSDMGALWLAKFQTGDKQPVGQVWLTQLPAAPGQVDLCRAPLLVGVPRAREVISTLYALDRDSGAPIGEPREVTGYWADGDSAVTVVDGQDVVTLSRSLAPADAPAGREPRPAMWLGAHLSTFAMTRLVRSVDGTTALVRAGGRTEWLGAPVDHATALLRRDRVVSGMWSAPKLTNANPPRLFVLPNKDASGAATEPPSLTTPALEHDPARETPASPLTLDDNARVVASADGVGKLRVGDVVLAGTLLAVATFESRPGPEVGAGISVFDLAARAFVFHATNVCGVDGMVVGLGIATDTVVCGARRHHPKTGEVIALDLRSGAIRWRRDFAAVDRIDAALDTILVGEGRRAHLLDARTGELRYEIDDATASAPRVALTTLEGCAVAVAMERDRLVARIPAAGGLPLWSLGVRAHVDSVLRADGAVVVTTAEGRAYAVEAAGGKVTALSGRSYGWEVPGGGDRVVDGAVTADGWATSLVQGLDGAAFGRVPPANQAPFVFGPRTPGAAVVAMSGSPGVGEVLQRGDRDADRGRGRLPQRATAGGVFGAVLADGTYVGMVLQAPLAIALERVAPAVISP